MCNSLENNEKDVLSVNFNIPYHILIRDFDISESADFVHIKCANDPVIPGTSWAGFFRNTIYKLLKEAKVEEDNIKSILNDLFGYVLTEENNKNNDMKIKKSVPSKIIFDESEIKESQSIDYTRNRVDRFTGGVVEGALFTEKSQYNGKTTLTAYFPKEYRDLLLVALLEIDYGLAAIGGSTAVGKGILEVESVKINDKTINLKEIEGREIVLPGGYNE